MRTCPVCGSGNPDDADSCSSCGADLSSGEPEAAGGEATVVVADLSVSSGVRARYPGAAHRLGTSFEQVCRREVESHHGTFRQLGDQVVIAFRGEEEGWGHAARAVDLAIRIQRWATEAVQGLGTVPEGGFRLHVGMHSGPLGADPETAGPGDLLADGTVALAGRLERAARPGQVLLSSVSAREAGAEDITVPVEGLRRRRRLRPLEPVALEVGRLGEAMRAAEPPGERAEPTGEEAAFEEAVPAPPRFANVAVARAEDDTVVPASSSLATGRGYVLRLDIGELSPESVVENAREWPVPEHLLPRREGGHWLDALVVSDTLDVETDRYPLFLPDRGSSWVCACEPGFEHRCPEDEREPYVRIAFRTLDEPGTADMRIGLYHEGNLVQSQLLRAEVLESEEDGHPHRSRIDYTLTAHLGDLAGLAPRSLNVLTNRNGDGTHRLVFNGRGRPVSFTLTEGQMGGAMKAARAKLREMHIRERRSLGRTKYVNLYDGENRKSPERFLEDLTALAELGSLLWSMLLNQRLDDLLNRKDELATTVPIQVSRAGETVFVFPWALVYDIPLERGDPRYTPCPLVARWEEMAALDGSWPDRCPHAEAHATNVLCPFGFWGFRHVIEQPPSTGQRGTLAGAITVSGDGLTFVLGRSLELDPALATAHRERLGASLPDGATIVDCGSRDAVARALADPDLELVYFYCHGRREVLAEGMEPVPYLEIGQAEKLFPSDLQAWVQGEWPRDHWKVVAPLVFINGCHTAELTPEGLVNFVDTFCGVRALGVVGTEVSVHQAVAGEVAEMFFEQLKAQPVGEALRRVRLSMVAKGNMMGLAYTPFCSAALHLS
ncbi:MAG: hypothetical protein HY658_05400 [Actinobacteria bacterium]|nr:hypothetical protein [Actinomycetota bacterium]